MATYTKKFLYSYLLRAVSMILGTLSLFIVSPFITSNKEVYGIYAVCISLTMFFSYADIGFLTSSQKFAAEAYASGNKRLEMEIVGFACFVLLSILLVVGSTFFFIAYNPQLLIRGINGSNLIIARKLLLILSFSFPIFCFQRICSVFFLTRLSDYFSQIIGIISGILRISSVFLFFGDEKYDIVGYYFTIQLIGLLALIANVFLLRIKFNLCIKEFLNCIKFSKSIFSLLKGLAFASLYSTICWIFYFEIDNIVISKLLGPEAVAIYSIAFSIFSVFRGVFSSIYYPFIARFNYFVGQGNVKGLNDYLHYIIEVFLPITLIPVIIMAFSASPFVISWVGDKYAYSSQILVFLLLGTLLTFISTPSGQYIVSLKKNKYVYANNTLCVLIYWGGVLFSFRELGVVSFSVMKAVALGFSGIYMYIVTFRIMKSSVYKFSIKLAKSYTLPIIACMALSFLITPHMMLIQGKFYLMLNIFVILIMGGVSYFIFYLFSPFQRKVINMIWKDVIIRKK